MRTQRVKGELSGDAAATGVVPAGRGIGVTAAGGELVLLVVPSPTDSVASASDCASGQSRDMAVLILHHLDAWPDLNPLHDLQHRQRVGPNRVKADGSYDDHHKTEELAYLGICRNLLLVVNTVFDAFAVLAIPACSLPAEEQTTENESCPPAARAS